MKPLVWRDQKLYRISATDYGDLPQRTLGVIAYSLVRGAGLALMVVLVFLSPRLFSSFRDWYKLFSALAAVCAIGVGIADRSLYLCEIEIFSDRIIRHSGEKTQGIGRSEVRAVTEGGCWTLFGRVRGLAIRSKGTTIFIPAGCPDYPEIRSRLGGWRPEVF